MGTIASALVQPFLPPLRTVRHYDLTKLRHDLLAGLTVSVVEVPQSMAYALIAGVPPQYGLYTSIIQGAIGALLSSSEHLTTGPTNTQSLLIASAVTRLASPTANPQLYLELMFVLTFLKGVIQLVFAAASMGNMVRYVSRSVIVGLAAGAGVLIAVGQLPNFLGIDVSQEPRHLPGVLGAFERLMPHLGQINLRAVGIGALGLAIVIGIRAISRLLPGALLAVVSGAAIVYLTGWTSGQLPLIPSLPRGFPSFHIPQVTWGYTESLFGGALALAILGMLESVAIVKAIAAQTGERIVPNQEFFAQGFKNLVSSFFQCIPGSGSFTRSALDHAAGAATRFAAVFNAIFVAIIFWGFAAQAGYIPTASLAAVLLVIAYGLIDWKYIARALRTSRSDAMVCGITFLATLVLPLEYAIFTGIFLNIALYLRTASRLHIAEMIQTPAGGIIETPLADRTGQKQVIFLQVEGDLFFGIADELQDRLAHLARGRPRVVIFRLKRTHSIDSTVLHVLEDFTRQLHANHRHVLLCGVRPQLMRVLRDFGLFDLIGRENIFESGQGVFVGAKQALARAESLVGASIDAEPLGSAIQPQSPAGGI